MGSTPSLPSEARDDVARDARLLAWDLACAAGASSEIATTWRRAEHDLPGLPLEFPEHLHDAACQLEATAWSIAAVAAGQPSEQAVALLSRRVCALSDEVAAARAAHGGTGGTGGADVGDTLLWESLTAALRDAADHARQLAAR